MCLQAVGFEALDSVAAFPPVLARRRHGRVDGGVALELALWHPGGAWGARCS